MFINLFNFGRCFQFSKSDENKINYWRFLFNVTDRRKRCSFFLMMFIFRMCAREETILLGMIFIVVHQG